LERIAIIIPKNGTQINIKTQPTSLHDRLHRSVDNASHQIQVDN